MSRTLMVQTRSSLNGELSQKLGVINEVEELKRIRVDLFNEINHGKKYTELADPNKNNLIFLDAYYDNTMLTEEDYTANVEYQLNDPEGVIDYFLQINFGYSINHAGLESHIAYYGDIPDEVYKLQEYLNLMGLKCPIVPLNSNVLENVKNDRINDHTHIIELTVCGMDNPAELKYYNRDEFIKSIVLAFTPDKDFRYNNFFYETDDNYTIYIGSDGEPVKNVVAHNKYWNENGYLCTGLFKTVTGDYMYADDQTGELAKDGWFEVGAHSHNYVYADENGIVIPKDDTETMVYQKIIDGAAYNFGPYLISVRYGNVYDQHPKIFRATDGKLYPFVHNIK